MNILSIAFVGHDHNASFFDGKNIKYIKHERIKQVKRFAYNHIDEMINDTCGLFKITKESCDFIVIISSEYKKNLNKNEVILDHHYAHALSTEFLSNQKPKTHFVIDGLGDSKTWSVFKKDKLVGYGNLENGSVGWGMREMGLTLGIKAQNNNDIAGKLMSLQSYGKVDHEFLKILEKFTLRESKKIFDPQIWINHIGDVTLAQNKLLNWAATVNYAMNNILLNHFKQYSNVEDIITYSGGVAQNVVWNTTLKKHFKNLIIVPHSCDEGLSIGGIQWAAKHFNLSFQFKNFPYAQYDEGTVDDPSKETIEKVAVYLTKGKTVGWYQNHGEIGPRALGNRSILIDPRLINGKTIINKIKNREIYRPFGASVLKEFKNKYFDMEWDDPYMLYTAKLKNNDLPCVQHIDNTCRIQTVDYKNKSFYELIEKFYSLTGCPILLNTSLNVAGKPIAGSPKDAMELFNNSFLEVMVIGNTIYTKDHNNSLLLNI
jgi:carbamoyltransferase